MGPARDADLCPLRSRFAPRRCSYNKTKPCQRTRRSTRPGCEWGPARGADRCPLRARFAPGAVLLQQKPNPASEPVGAPAPGANGGLPGRKYVPASFAVRTGAVRRSGDAPTAKNQNVPPRTRRSTRPGCEWGPARDANLCPPRPRFAPGRSGDPAVLLQQKPKLPEPVGAPAPGANG